jgi:ribosome modulation factor
MIDPLKAAYDAGYEAGVDGPNPMNCHSVIFSTPEMTKAWEQGKADGDRAKAARE